MRCNYKDEAGSECADLATHYYKQGPYTDPWFVCLTHRNYLANKFVEEKGWESYARVGIQGVAAISCKVDERGRKDFSSEEAWGERGYWTIDMDSWSAVLVLK